jgi:hypothetical protein
VVHGKPYQYASKAFLHRDFGGIALNLSVGGSSLRNTPQTDTTPQSPLTRIKDIDCARSNIFQLGLANAEPFDAGEVGDETICRDGLPAWPRSVTRFRLAAGVILMCGALRRIWS